MRRSIRLAWGLAAILAASHAHGTGLPPDMAVYGEQPTKFRDGTTNFPTSGSSWDYRVQSDDPFTRLKFRDVPGLANVLGTFPHGVATFGKYVLMGNGSTVSTGGAALFTSIGIFDTETKIHCDLLISTQAPKGTPYLAVANPNSRQSRIIFGAGAPDPVIGYLMADLDTDACSWPVVTADYAELNGSVGPICPELPPFGNIACAFDGFSLLAHEEPNPADEFGTDYVAVSDYYSQGVAVVRLDTGGIQSVAFYQNKPYAPPSGGGICYSSSQARRPESNFKPIEDDNRNGDWRFLMSYDSFPVETFSTTPPAECSTIGFCPQDTSVQFPPAKGEACPGAGVCTVKYCTLNPKQSCTTNSNCVVTLPGFDPIDLGPCTDTCITKSSAYKCRTSSGGGTLKQCLSDKAEPSYFCTSSQETCSSGGPASIPAASQEFRYAKATNTLGPTSSKFYGASGPIATGPTSATYDSDGASWVYVDLTAHGYYRPKTGGTCTVNGGSVPATPGERCYYTATPGNTAVVVPPDDQLTFEVLPTIPYLPATQQVGNRMYVADVGSLQYATRDIFANWVEAPATTYKQGFAYLPASAPITDPLAHTSLPLDPHRCSGASQAACDVTADCPSGETCVALGEGGIVQPPLLSTEKFVTLGGSPPSLWFQSGYAQRVELQYPPIAQTDKFLLRVPLTTYLPDNATTTRPAIAFDGTERLWLVTEHGGELKYRIRLRGGWTDWYSLAPNNITAVGGPAVIASPTWGIRVYARSSSGVVYEKVNTDPYCDPGACVWSNWTALPSTVTTNDDIAASYVAGGPARFVAVRRASDNGVYVTGSSIGWIPWFKVGTLMATDRAPALAYHSPDGKLWIAARLNGSSTGAQMYSRIDPTTLAWDSWAGTPTTGAPSVFGTSMGLASDGTAMRMVSTDTGQIPYETANDGSGWSSWRKSPAGGLAGRQPALANVSGEIDAVTVWASLLQQASIP
jgi:hypothetical protein